MIGAFFFGALFVSAEEVDSAFLKNLSITNGMMNTKFDAKVQTYSVTVDAGTISLGIEYELEDPYAAIVIHGNDYLYAGGEVTIDVISSSGKQKESYRIMVNVEEEQSAFLEDDMGQALEVRPSTYMENHQGMLAVTVALFCVLAILFVFRIFFLRKRRTK